MMVGREDTGQFCGRQQNICARADELPIVAVCMVWNPVLDKDEINNSILLSKTSL